MTELATGPVHSAVAGQSQAIIQTVGLTKHYRSVKALTDFSCQIERGQVIGLLGPNGSGKSTLVRLLLGFLKPTAGSARIMNADCLTQSVEVQKHVAYLPGDARLFRTMRGRDVLDFFGSIRGKSTLDQATTIARQLELDLSRWVAFMSTGMRQKLALAVVLALDTPVLILDEPTANLDPSVRHEVLDLVGEAKSHGRTVIFSSHVLSEIVDVCDRVFILRSGRLVHEQNLRHLDEQHQIIAQMDGPLPTMPAEIRHLKRSDQPLKMMADNAMELSAVLRWLSSCPVNQVQIRPFDLRSIYDQFHREST